jgi:N12 class adenine-specific DNA methylase
LEEDPEYYLVMGLEVVGKERRGDVFEKVIKPADILSQRTLFPVTPPTHAADVKDAALVSMQYRGKIDVPYVAELTGMQPEDAEQSIIDSGLAFKNPVSGLMETRDAYLSSNVRQKLREAEAAAKDDPRYEKNVEQLKAIQPERIGFENISARAGSSWIPEPVYTSFAQKVLGKSAKVTYNKTLDRWSVSLSGKETGAAENKSIYGTERASGTDILGDVLNLRNPKIYDTVEEMNEAGKMSKKQVLNKTATDQAQAKALRFKQEFDTFMREDPDANKSIEDTYNEQFNSYVVPQFDGSHLVFPGMASVYKGKPLKLRSNQKDGIFRVTQTGGALLAHGVGAGKTITIIASAMEMRRLGLARKPLIVVDKPTTGQFAQTFRQVYPNANVLVATEDSFTAANRKRFMSRIATGNWDAVVMSNSQFDLMPNDPAVIQQYVQTSIDQLKEIAAEVEGEEGKGTPKVRQIRTEIKRLENRLGKLLDRLGKRQDDTIYFEQSGVDALFVDEAHGYKKVPFVTKMDPVKGIDRQPSQKAIALHAKVQFVHENNRFKNVITATGTPVTNTLAEAWNMTRLVNPKLLEEWGVDTFDKFVSTFAEVVNSTEINAANQWVSVERLSRFTNGPELVKMIRTAWDVRMGEDLKDLTLPSIKGGKPELVSLEVTPEQLQITSFLQSVYKQFQGLKAKERRAYSWIPIVTMSTGMAASVDPRLVNPSLPDNPNSVINKAVENVAAIYHETTPKRSTQIVFLDRYRPMNTEKIRRFAAGADVHVGSDGQSADEALKEQASRHAMEPGDNAFSDSPLNLYDDLRDKLVKAGVPREEIAIAAEHDSDAKRLKMQEDMQTGRIRVLIGSTAKIGQGINVSDKLYAAHHLDPPIQMTPAQYIQRNGRIIRDPNENTEVRMLNYGMKRTLAAGIWDRINTKAKFIIQILMGKGVGRDFEDPADEITMSIAEQVAELTGDRRVLQKVELESQVRALQSAREAHYNNIGSARRNLRETQDKLGQFDREAIPNAEKDKALLERTFGPEGKNVEIKVGNKSFNDLKEYDATIKDLIETGQKKAEAHFADQANKKDWHLTFDIHQEINGLWAETRLVFTNPEKRMSYEDKIDVQTAFSSPNTRLIGTSRATTGSYIWFAAKKLWTERDERIADLTRASQNAREQIPKLEAEANKTFTQEKELETKSAELDKLTLELLDGDSPKEASGGSLTDDQPPTLAAPEPTDPNKDVLKSAYSELPEIEKKVVSAKLAGKPDTEIAKSLKLSETAVNTAYQIALRKLQRARDAAQDIRRTMREVVAEKPGQRTMGRPQLANPAAGELSRKLVDTVDEIRKRSDVPARRKDKDVIAEARARMAKDYGGERRDLLEKAARGLQLDDTETVIAKRIVAREALGAVRVGSNDKILEAAKLIDAYRMTGSSQARAFRQRSDEYLSPEERASQYISESLLTPDEGRRNRLSQLGEQIVDLEQQLEEAKNRNLDPMKLKELLDERTKRLEEREKIIASWTRKIEGIKKKAGGARLGLGEHERGRNQRLSQGQD